MKISISGHRFDTDKATRHFALYYWDGNNRYDGDVYLSSAGTWYVYTPSQWSNMHSWRIMDPGDILNDYDRYLTEEDKEAIAQLAELEWE